MARLPSRVPSSLCSGAGILAPPAGRRLGQMAHGALPRLLDPDLEEKGEVIQALFGAKVLDLLRPLGNMRPKT